MKYFADFWAAQRKCGARSRAGSSLAAFIAIAAWMVPQTAGAAWVHTANGDWDGTDFRHPLTVDENAAAETTYTTNDDRTITVITLPDPAPAPAPDVNNSIWYIDSSESLPTFQPGANVVFNYYDNYKVTPGVDLGNIEISRGMRDPTKGVKKGQQEGVNSSANHLTLDLEDHTVKNVFIDQGAVLNLPNGIRAKNILAYGHLLLGAEQTLEADKLTFYNDYSMEPSELARESGVPFASYLGDDMEAVSNMHFEANSTINAPIDFVGRIHPLGEAENKMIISHGATYLSTVMAPWWSIEGGGKNTDTLDPTGMLDPSAQDMSDMPVTRGDILKPSEEMMRSAWQAGKIEKMEPHGGEVTLEREVEDEDSGDWNTTKKTVQLITHQGPIKADGYLYTSLELNVEKSAILDLSRVTRLPIGYYKIARMPFPEDLEDEDLEDFFVPFIDPQKINCGNRKCELEIVPLQADNVYHVQTNTEGTLYSKNPYFNMEPVAGDLTGDTGDIGKVESAVWQWQAYILHVINSNDTWDEPAKGDTKAPAPAPQPAPAKVKIPAIQLAPATVWAHPADFAYAREALLLAQLADFSDTFYERAAAMRPAQPVYARVRASKLKGASKYLLQAGAFASSEIDAGSLYGGFFAQARGADYSDFRLRGLGAGVFASLVAPSYWADWQASASSMKIRGEKGFGELFTRAELGYLHKIGRWSIEPSAGLAMLHQGSHRFSAVEFSAHTSLRAEPAIFAAYNAATWRVEAGVRAHLELNGAGKISARVPMMAGDSVLNGANTTRLSDGLAMLDGSILVDERGHRLQELSALRELPRAARSSMDAELGVAWQLGRVQLKARLKHRFFSDFKESSLNFSIQSDFD